MNRNRSPFALLLRIAAAFAAVALLTLVDYRLLHVNTATAGFSFLLLVLVFATWIGLSESIVASLASAVVYNFFFFPPVGTFTIADPQNWVALLTFLATAVTVSQLSARARNQTEQARARQQELERMYDFSRGLLLGNENYALSQQVIRQVVESFKVKDASFYDSSRESTSRVEGTESALSHAAMLQVATSGIPRRDVKVAALIVPITLGGAKLGSLGIAGENMPSEMALQAIAQLIAIALERARVSEVSARLELARQNEQLKSTLLDALAHEFKTPLTSVKAATTTLLSAPLETVDSTQLITIIDEEADRLTMLVNDSIELARLGMQPIALNPELITPAELISSAAEALRGLADGREIKIDLSPAMPSVRVDVSLTGLALRQILGNAMKYSPAGTPVTVAVKSMDGFIRISIHNLGPGISKADQKRIFEKFYRGKDVLGRIPGTGLGLGIARDITRAQGGDLSVRSEETRGATFYLTLPVSVSPAPPLEHLQPVAP